MFVVAGLALLLCLVSLVRGLRGRRVGTEPRCAKCGFDLTGLVERGTTTCPECGQKLDAPGAVMTGVRRRRRWALALAAALLVFSVGVALSASQRVNWIPYLPSRVLSEYTRWTGRDAALAELTTRLEAGTLGRGSVDGVVAAALAAQGDLNTAWNHRWGAFVETASLKKLLSSPDERKYLDQVVTVANVQSRRATLSGWRVPVQADLRLRRGGLRGVNVKNVFTANIKGFEPKASAFVGGGFGVGASPNYAGGDTLGMGLAGVPAPNDPPAPPGEHTLNIEYRWWTFWEGDEPSSYELTEEKLPPASGKWSQARPLTIGERVEDVVEAAAAGDQVPQVMASDLGILTRRETGMARTSRQGPDGKWERFTGENPTEVAVYLQAGEHGVLPAGGVVAYDVFLLVNGEEQWIGRTALAPGANECLNGLVSFPPRPRMPTVDLLLRPSSEALLTRAVGRKQLAAEELIIKNVQVREGYPQLRPGQGTRAEQRERWLDPGRRRAPAGPGE